MTDAIVTIMIGDPENARYLITASRTSATTEKNKLIYPAFEILNDQPTMRGEMRHVTVISDGLSKEEEILTMRALTEHFGNTGAAARQFFFQNVSPS